jgi:hypothetical protein
MQTLYQSTLDHIPSKDEKLLIRPFAKNKEYKDNELMKVKIHILFYGENS